MLFFCQNFRFPCFVAIVNIINLSFVFAQNILAKYVVYFPCLSAVRLRIIRTVAQWTEE